MDMLDHILTTAVGAKASDIHINVGLPPMMRVNTVVQPLEGFPIVDVSTAEGLLRAMLSEEERWSGFMKLRDADFSYHIPGVSRFRVNAHFQKGGIAIAFRTINDRIRPMSELNLPEAIQKLTNLPRA